MARRRRSLRAGGKYAQTTKELPNTIKVMGDDGSNNSLVECLFTAGLAYQDPNAANKAIITKTMFVKWNSLVTPTGVEAVEIARDTGVGESYHSCDIDKPMKIVNKPTAINLSSAATGNPSGWIKFYGGQSYNKATYTVARMYDAQGQEVTKPFAQVVISTLV